MSRARRNDAPRIRPSEGLASRRSDGTQANLQYNCANEATGRYEGRPDLVIGRSVQGLRRHTSNRAPLSMKNTKPGCAEGSTTMLATWFLERQSTLLVQYLRDQPPPSLPAGNVSITKLVQAKMRAGGRSQGGSVQEGAEGTVASPAPLHRRFVAANSSVPPRRAKEFGGR